MDRTELITITTIMLFAAFLLGWLTSWLIQRLTRVSQGDIGEMERLAQALHEAEEARDAAALALEELEDKTKSRHLQAEAELRATMEALRDSRAEIEDLRSYIDKQLARAKTQAPLPETDRP